MTSEQICKFTFFVLKKSTNQATCKKSTNKSSVNGNVILLVDFFCQLDRIFPKFNILIG